MMGLRVMLRTASYAHMQLIYSPEMQYTEHAELCHTECTRHDVILFAIFIASFPRHMSSGFTA
jgi:hypothetical protein